MRRSPGSSRTHLFLSNGVLRKTLDNKTPTSLFSMPHNFWKVSRRLHTKNSIYFIIHRAFNKCSHIRIQCFNTCSHIGTMLSMRDTKPTCVYSVCPHFIMWVRQCGLHISILNGNLWQRNHIHWVYPLHVTNGLYFTWRSLWHTAQRTFLRGLDFYVGLDRDA